MRYVFSIAALTLVAGALAQAGWGPQSPLNAQYDPKNEVTFEGKVMGILVSPPMRGMAPGVNLLVKSANGGSSLVVLGPQSFVAKQRVKIALKDEVKVVGSKVSLDAKRTAILASTVSKNGQQLVLRNDAGGPLWTVAMERDNSSPQPQNVGGGTQVLGGETIDLSNAENPRLVVSTPEGDVQVELGQDWYMSNQRSTYTMNELMAINGVFNNVGMPGRIIILPSQNRGGVMYLTPYWPGN